MKYTLRLEIKNQLPPSLNVALRAHWTKQRRNVKLWDILIAAETIMKRPKEPLAKARIRIVRHSHAFLDYDGLVGSMKPVVDSLVTIGILKDDNYRVTGPWDVSQEFRPLKEGTLLVIEVNEE